MNNFFTTEFIRTWRIRWCWAENISLIYLRSLASQKWFSKSGQKSISLHVPWRLSQAFPDKTVTPPRNNKNYRMLNSANNWSTKIVQPTNWNESPVTVSPFNIWQIHDRNVYPYHVPNERKNISLCIENCLGDMNVRDRLYQNESFSLSLVRNLAYQKSKNRKSKKRWWSLFTSLSHLIFQLFCNKRNSSMF